MPDLYAVIGNPVAHSKSPWIHAQFARACAQDMEYRRIEAPLDGFAAAVEAFRRAGGRGLNVTLPFKGEAFRYSAKLTGRARAAQAVNTLRLDGEVAGDTTDGAGLVLDLQGNLGFSLNTQRVLLMGAGGAAQGVVGALLEAGAAGVVIANRTVEKARTLADRFAGASASGYAELAPGAFDVVINATSSGLAGEGIALPRGVLGKEVLAYDMVYGRDTPFLAAAREAGARTSDGLGMLVEQAAESFLIWRGVRPDTQGVLKQLRAG
jgi:shikimate dehydrogenase